MAMNLIPGVESTGSALTAEKLRLEIIAQNIANSNTTRDASGNVYKRKEVSFEEYVKRPERRVPGYVDENLYQGVRVTDVFDDQTPGRIIFNPGHPHANEDGMVEMPNVDVSREMIDLISASRAYEANLTVVKLLGVWLNKLWQLVNKNYCERNIITSELKRFAYPKY